MKHFERTGRTCWNRSRKPILSLSEISSSSSLIRQKWLFWMNYTLPYLKFARLHALYVYVFINSKWTALLRPLKALYSPVLHSHTHTCIHWWWGLPRQPIHQEQFGVKYLAQGRIDTWTGFPISGRPTLPPEPHLCCLVLCICHHVTLNKYVITNAAVRYIFDILDILYKERVCNY